jgi:hypothetical protein
MRFFVGRVDLVGILKLGEVFEELAYVAAGVVFGKMHPAKVTAALPKKFFRPLPQPFRLRPGLLRLVPRPLRIAFHLTPLPITHTAKTNKAICIG